MALPGSLARTPDAGDANARDARGHQGSRISTRLRVRLAGLVLRFEPAHVARSASGRKSGKAPAPHLDDTRAFASAPYRRLVAVFSLPIAAIYFYVDTILAGAEGRFKMGSPEPHSCLPSLVKQAPGNTPLGVMGVRSVVPTTLRGRRPRVLFGLLCRAAAASRAGLLRVRSLTGSSRPMQAPEGLEALQSRLQACFESLAGSLRFGHQGLVRESHPRRPSCRQLTTTVAGRDHSGRRSESNMSSIESPDGWASWRESFHAS